MTRKFGTPDYATTLNTTIRLGEALPPNHLARFIVDLVAQLDLRPIYARYGERGGEAFAPEVLLALLFYGYATGGFSSRKLENATYEHLACRYVAGGLPPDHDTIATFRKLFLPELQELFVQSLRLAQLAGVLTLGNLSLDGSKIHAEASKSQAVSYKRLGELEARRRREVHELLTRGEQADQGEVNLPDGLVIEDEVALRQQRLENLAQAKAVLETRAQERHAAEQAEYEAKVREREAKARKRHRKPRGRAPTPPEPGPQDKDHAQRNFTDPDSRIMTAKRSTEGGFDQHYNVQVAVDQASWLIVALSLSNHPKDQQEVEPPLEALSPCLGQPQAAALDNGYFSPANVQRLEAPGIEPYIATGRDPHHQSWQGCFAEQATPPPTDASLKEQMAYQLQTEIGQAIDRLRKCTVEPVMGILKEVLGSCYGQFSLPGLAAAAGEWWLVCLAFNLKRLHGLLTA